MKSFHKLAIIILTITASNVSNATMSSSMPLESGSVLPGQTLLISTDKLYENLRYTLTCTIKNSNPLANKISDFAAFAVFAQPSVDNSNIKNGTDEISHFNSKGSILEFSPVSKRTKNVYIRNFDYTDTYVVEDCVAHLIG